MPYVICLWDKPDWKDRQEKEVGRIVEKSSHKIIALIILSDNYVRQRKMRSLFVTLLDGKYYIFVTQKQFAKIQKRVKTDLFLLYHEVGHIYYDHLKDVRDVEVVKRERREKIKQGTVSENELEADAFAADMIGVDIAIKALEKLSTERLEFDYQNGTHENPLAILTQKEFRYRIQILQDRLKN